jgi:alpha-galactosidase
MIIAGSFGSSKHVVEVSTRQTSMIFTADENKPVIFQYWGEKLSDANLYVEKRFNGQPDTGDSFAPQVFPAYGGRYVLNPALRLIHSDGVLTTDLVFVKSVKKVIDPNCTETIISLKDKIYPVYVDIHFLAYSAEDVICQSANIYHSESGNIKVENFASSYFPLHSNSYYLTHFHGTWAAEMQMVEEKLTQGTKIIESKKGVRTTQSENPSFLISLNREAEEDLGEVYAGSLAWSGNYQLSFQVDECGLLNVISGMNPFASTYNLKPNQRFETPQMILTYSNKGKGQVSRNLHDWSRTYSLSHGNKLNPVVLNSWEGAYFSFDEQIITSMIDNAAKIGVEMFVLDDGWFGNKYPRDSDHAGLGDWQVNTKKLPRGLNYLANYAKEKGIDFGIWIEPEMVNPESELAKIHPEWIVKSGKREILPMRNQWLLDLTNPEVQDFVIKTFDDVLSQSALISYVKWDANRHVDNVGSEYLSDNEQSHFWIEYTKGLYKVYEEIRKKHPEIIIQLCSSGGGRLDFGALKYHDEFWASDNTNALDRIFIQYGTNTFFPAQATGSHVSTSPNHQTDMITPLKFRFDVAMSGRLGLELQPKSLIGEDYEFAKKAIENYKNIRPIVQLGDLYRLVSPYDENGWSSLMYVSKDKSQSVVFAYSLKYHGRTTYFESKLKGLNPEKEYQVTEINNSGNSCFEGNGMKVSGDYLMKVGIKINIGKPLESAIIHVQEI